MEETSVFIEQLKYERGSYPPVQSNLRLSSSSSLSSYIIPSFTIQPKIIIIIIIITRTQPAIGRHGLAGSSGGDQSERINSLHSIKKEAKTYIQYTYGHFIIIYIYHHHHYHTLLYNPTYHHPPDHSLRKKTLGCRSRISYSSCVN